jgi:uridine kinase
MWITFLPLVFLCDFLGIPIQFGYSFTLLIADFVLLMVLNKMLDARQRLILFAYWLSPVVILASYGFGLNDLIPLVYLMCGVLFLKLQRLTIAGVFFAIAISAKLSMLVILPFVMLYLYNNKPLRQLINKFLIGIFFASVFILIPFLLSNSGMQMLIKNPEMGNILGLSFEVGTESVIYLLPGLFVSMLYLIWRIRRLNFDLFMAICGIAFLALVILMPSAIGWFVWTIPFLVFYQALSGRTSVVIISMFSIFFVLGSLLKEDFYFLNGIVLNLSFPFENLNIFSVKQFSSVIDTGIFVIGFILAIRMWRESISDNNFFRQSREPFMIGIAGDSGSGKDTLADSISGLFGNHSIATISGDDYHLWDRHKPMWQAMTHLNPMANDLNSFSRDIFSLKSRKSIRSSIYNHQTGKMSKLIKQHSNDFVLASGLHVLYMPTLRDIYNLKIYLDIDEGLRRYFKIKRDVGMRGHSEQKVIKSINAREADANKFIRSQRKYADLVLSLQPILPTILDDPLNESKIQLKLEVTTYNGLSELALNRALVGLCGLHVDMTVSNDGAEVTTIIEGDTTKEDIALAAKLLSPGMLEFFDISPKWQDGALGIMQLVTVYHIEKVLTKRNIK